MKKLILFTLLISIVSSSNALALTARDDQTGDCIRKGKCKD